MLMWSDAYPPSEVSLLISVWNVCFRNKKVTYFAFFTYVYLIPTHLLLLQPFPKYFLSLHEKCSQPHVLIHCSHYPNVFVSSTNCPSYIFNTDSLIFFSWWYVEIPSLTYSSNYNIEIVLLEWRMKSYLYTDLTFHLQTLSPQPGAPVLGNLCCIDSKKEELLSDSYTVSFISIQSRAGI